MSAPGKSLREYLKDVSGVLNKPVNIHAFLTTPIPIPFVGKPKRRKRPAGAKRKGAEGTSTASQSRNFILEGTLERGMHAKFSVGNTDFEIDANTWIVGSIEYGARVKVKGVSQAESKIATQVIVLRNT